MEYSILYDGNELFSENIDDENWELKDCAEECKNYIESKMTDYRLDSSSTAEYRNFLKEEYAPFIAIIDGDEHTYEDLLSVLDEMDKLCADEKYYFELGEKVFVHSKDSLISMGMDLSQWSDYSISMIGQEITINRREFGQNNTGIYYDDSGVSWYGDELTTTIGQYIDKTPGYSNVEVYCFNAMKQVIKLYEGKKEELMIEARDYRIEHCNKTGGSLIQIRISEEDAALFIIKNQELEKKKLAASLDQFFYEYDTYEYNDQFNGDRELGISHCEAVLDSFGKSFDETIKYLKDIVENEEGTAEDISEATTLYDKLVKYKNDSTVLFNNTMNRRNGGR